VRRRGPNVPPIVATSLAAVTVLLAAATGWIALTQQDADDAVKARLAGIEATQHDDATGAARRSAKLDQLSDQITQLAQAATAQAPSAQASRLQAAPDAALTNRLSVLEAEVKPLAARLDEIDRRIQDAAGSAHSAGERAKSADELGEQQKSGSERTAQQESENAMLLAQIAARLADVEAALKLTQAQAQAAGESAADVMLRHAIVATALRAAVERGYPFVTELATAHKIGLDPTALSALEPFAATGVPNVNVLFREFSALVPQLLRASVPPAQQADRPVGQDGTQGDHHAGSYLDRLQTGFEKLVRIRPVGDLRGEEPTAVIGRIDVAMTRRDVGGVEVELDRLPVPARDLAEPWRNKVHARDAAIAAARQLAASSLAEIAEAPTSPPGIRPQ
jgi:hypothetical protein